MTSITHRTVPPASQVEASDGNSYWNRTESPMDLPDGVTWTETVPPPRPLVSLTDFLHARLSEDERIARAAAAGQGQGMFSTIDGANWTNEDGLVVGENEHGLWDCEGASSLCMSVEAGEHVARHDPARVLREVAAKRAIIELLRLDDSIGGDDYSLDKAVRALATAYSDHVDYNPKWSA